MFINKTVLLLGGLFTCLQLLAQPGTSKDTASLKQLDEVIVTATRTAQKLGNVAVPVTIIHASTIQQSGSLRLNNILQEQTGIYITSSFGNGVQLQGLSPDYVLILIDGEPLVGRNGGVLDLNRISVSNIKQIEIVKGPSSSLYGSEAMGGVINIITSDAGQPHLEAGVRYGSYHTVDANVSGSYRYKGFSLSGAVNRNSTGGYDVNKADTGKTQMPYYSYTGQLKLQQQLTANGRLGVSLRYYNEHQQDLYSSGTALVTGRPVIKEYNINPYLQWQFGKTVHTALRGYFSQFQTDTRDYLQGKDSLYYDDFFQQRFQRVETQTDISIAASNDLTAGAGYTWERLNTNRYSGIRTNTIGYAYVQDEHRFGKHVSLIGGARYDHNEAYASRLSPKLALQVKASSALTFNASYGAGFKAPDFRQLYLNFTNNAAGGYTVYGSNEISYQLLQQQQQAGILASLTPFAANLHLLRPEYSTGINAGAKYRAGKKALIGVNFFRNDIDNLIITRIIAYKPSNAPVYSYFNVNSAYTEGAELQFDWQWNKQLKISAGYQYLVTADKEVLKQIKSGQLFGKKPGSLESVQLKRSDYGGLTDRSKHMANIKLTYENKRWFATARALYRSRWGVGDVDGNLILNRSDEYASGYVQVNISAGKTIARYLQLKAGVDDVTNYRNTRYIAGLPGITYYASLTYQFFNHKNNQND